MPDHDAEQLKPSSGHPQARFAQAQHGVPQIRIATLPSYVHIACDSRQDKDLLWDAFGKGLPPNLSLRRYELKHLLHSKSFQTAARDFQAKQGGWHHALYDAQANRAGWLA